MRTEETRLQWMHSRCKFTWQAVASIYFLEEESSPVCICQQIWPWTDQDIKAALEFDSVSQPAKGLSH